tara:strand:+ start:526 stop:858 length:333 start_codon:yes stop_codon:yes gene_type:complete
MKKITLNFIFLSTLLFVIVNQANANRVKGAGAELCGNMITDLDNNREYFYRQYGNWILGFISALNLTESYGVRGKDVSNRLIFETVVNDCRNSTHKRVVDVVIDIYEKLR